MLSKFRLDGRNRYEVRLFALKLAKMLEGVVSSIPHSVEIGSEQGGIPHWDDIVEVRCDGTIQHTQVKRQGTPFCSSTPVRPSSTTELSVLDKALESLAVAIERKDLDDSGRRFFELMVLGPAVEVKKGIRIDQFREIVSLCSTDSFSSSKMADRKDTATDDIFKWLTTWCGFKDWDHIGSALSRMQVGYGGTEDQIDIEIIESLSVAFSNASEASDSLNAYIFREASDVGAINRRALMRYLKKSLRPDVASWTQYRKVQGTSCWELSGIHDLDEQDAERAPEVVAGLWAPDAARRVLQFQVPHTSMDVSKVTLPHAIMRLALHLNAGSQCLLEEASVWKAKAMDLTGETLGSSASDLKNLPWVESPMRPGAPMRHLDGISQSAAEATSLMQAMDDLVLSQLKTRVDGAIEKVKDVGLQTELDTLWKDWWSGLDQDPTATRALFSALLHPPTEGLVKASLLRVGPRALDLLETAVMTLLVVAVSIGGEGSTWSTFTNCGTVLSIALKQWSGPRGKEIAMRPLQSDDLQEIIGPNPNAVVVLSGVEAPASTFLEPVMSGVPYDSTSLIAQRRPKVLVTGQYIDRFLRMGDLENARTYFKSQWDAQVIATEQAASNAADGNQ
ncbi:ABC-three component system protein [Stenotrophomonas sp. Ker107b]